MDEPEQHRQARLAARAAKYHAEVQRLRELRNDQVCSHGVHPSNCNDHRPAYLAAKNGLNGATHE